MKLLEHIPGAVGLDEAGRGPLAGPVVAAAVWLPDDFDLSGLNDSKALTEERRNRLEARIREHARFAVAHCSPQEIDRLNILEASMEAMRRAHRALASAGEVFVDGNRVPSGMNGVAVVKGDAKLACIAAASILAKNERDRIMRGLDAAYPGYGFASHFGYPTPEHLVALRTLGPCPIHRRSFGPVSDCLQPGLFLS